MKKSAQAALLNATESCIRTSGWWLQSRHQAILRHRTTGKQTIEISHAATGMEFFFQRIMQLTHIDAGAFMAREKLLQDIHCLPVLSRRCQTS